MSPNECASDRTNLTATGTITGARSLTGVFVSSAASTPTLKIADAAGTIMNTITPTAGTFYRLPVVVKGDITVTISGTVDATVFYSK